MAFLQNFIFRHAGASQIEKKKPSIPELLDWLKLLVAEEILAEALRLDSAGKSIPPLNGTLLKNEQDLGLVERSGSILLSRPGGPPPTRSAWCASLGVTVCLP